MRAFDEPMRPTRRFECKYVLGQSLAERVRRYLEPYLVLDPFAARGGGRYVVTSTYLDSPSMRLYRETVEGFARRFKLRIRAYDGTTSPVFLEIKRRDSGTTSKSRLAVEAAQLHTLLRGSASLPEARAGRSVLDEFAGWMKHLDAGPTVLVRYEREAYVAIRDTGTRVTFDHQLCTAATDQLAPRQDAAGWQPFAPGRVILEFKFRNRFPPWMSSCVQRLELTRDSFSKYCNALRVDPRGILAAPEA